MNEQQNGQQLLQSHDEHNSRTTAYRPANRSEDVLDQTIGEALREAALRHGPRTALIDGTLEQGRRMELQRSSRNRRVGGALASDPLHSRRAGGCMGRQLA